MINEAPYSILRMRKATIEAFIELVVTNTYRLGNHNGCKETEATLIIFSLCPDPRQTRDIIATYPTRLRIYPDNLQPYAKIPVVHRILRQELNPLRQKSVCHRRVLLGVSWLAAHHNQFD